QRFGMSTEEAERMYQHGLLFDDDGSGTDELALRELLEFICSLIFRQLSQPDPPFYMRDRIKAIELDPLCIDAGFTDWRKQLRKAGIVAGKEWFEGTSCRVYKVHDLFKTLRRLWGE